MAETPPGARGRESLGGRNAHESNGSAPDQSSGDREHGSGCGEKPLERNLQVVWFGGEAPERTGFREGSASWPGMKALKGEPRECWRLKEVSKGVGARRFAERVAKPCARRPPVGVATPQGALRKEGG